MGNELLSKDSEFIVGEEKWLNYFVAGLFFCIFLFGIFDARSTNSTGLLMGSFLMLAPAIYFLIKARTKRIYIRINKKGIYHNELLITDWQHFLKAFITQKKVLGSVQDNFVLVVEYLKTDPKKGFRRMLPLTNTQNKSEEDVIAAVKFFWRQYKQETGEDIIVINDEF